MGDVSGQNPFKSAVQASCRPVLSTAFHPVVIIVHDFFKSGALSLTLALVVNWLMDLYTLANT
ncbi:hypothetical protein BDV33DRAFT_211101 [Aspergillus novoparasiticus]|uniref:Uncharacterized protein n=1 Tax=Aspergillus novoparasiticus TaxID=986946 RepID=A0A5N6E5X5_9EURO|nr:hypothetical protein BDV33DRAFT_211101 [Aspergillus novoparasiticus]